MQPNSFACTRVPGARGAAPCVWRGRGVDPGSQGVGRRPVPCSQQTAPGPRALITGCWSCWKVQGFWGARHQPLKCPGLCGCLPQTRRRASLPGMSSHRDSEGCGTVAQQRSQEEAPRPDLLGFPAREHVGPRDLPCLRPAVTQNEAVGRRGALEGGRVAPGTKECVCHPVAGRVGQRSESLTYFRLTDSHFLKLPSSPTLFC